MVQYFPVITGSLTVNGNVLITGSINTTAGITGSFSGTATTAQTASSVANLNQNVQITGSLTTSGTITAQTLNVQQVTSSIVYSSGSNVFGNSLSNTQTFTGSAYFTGSHIIQGNVGIGNTSPSYPLQVSSSIYVYRTDSNSSYPAQLIASSSGATVIARGGNSADLFLGRSGSANYANVYYADSTVWATSARWTVGMRSGDSNYQVYNETLLSPAINVLNTTNYVGIGTTNPGTILHVASGSGAGGTTYVLLSNSSPASNLNQAIQLSFGQDSGATSSTPNGYIKVLNTGGSTNYSAMAFGLYSGTTPAPEIMRITGSSLGIGTTTPTSKLGIKTAGADGIVLEQDSTDTTNSSRIFFAGSVQSFGLFNNGGDLRLTYAAQPGNTSGTSLARFTNTGKYFRMESGTGGIQFGGDTAAANALNDYEEGTWTPSIVAGGFGISSITARYTKIGRVVHCITDFNLTGSGSSGLLTIGGLPFTSLSVGYSANACYFQYINVDNRNLAAISLDTSTSIRFEIVPNSSGLARSAIGTDFSAGYCNLNIIYFTS